MADDSRHILGVPGLKLPADEATRLACELGVTWHSKAAIRAALKRVEIAVLERIAADLVQLSSKGPQGDDANTFVGGIARAAKHIAAEVLAVRDRRDDE